MTLLRRKRSELQVDTKDSEIKTAIDASVFDLKTVVSQLQAVTQRLEEEAERQANAGERRVADLGHEPDRRGQEGSPT